MEDKTVTLSRHLALVSVVDRNPGISISELSQLFGFSEEKMRQEILLLDHAGIGDMLPDQTFFFDMDLLERTGQVRLEYDLGASGLPLLTAEEVARLIAGLAAISRSLPEAEAAALPGLLGIALQMGGPDSIPDLPDISRLLSVVQIQTGRWDQLIEGAITNGREIVLTYLSADSRKSTRTVDPLSLFQSNDGWILRAWCHTARAERNFRLDRIAEAELGNPVDRGRLRRTPRAGGDLCKVTLSPESEWLLGELPIEDSKPVDAGIQVTFRVWDPKWMADELILIGSHVTDVDPAHYWDLAKAAARKALPAWDSLPPAPGQERPSEPLD